MKINYITVTINDLKFKEIELKLPMKNKNLQKILIKKGVAEINQSSIEYFDNPLKSVKSIDIKNFNIKGSTNIYYLNSYLDILKFKDLELPKENTNITTEKLKEMIAEILKIENTNLNLEKIYNLINKEITNSKTETNNNINSPEEQEEAEEESEKPQFSIKELLRKHMERKGE